MAQLEGLYLGMGIDTSQLHSDFVDAEKTINQNLARINNEMKLIKIKGQVELEGLDESASSAEKLRVQEEALTEQIGLQQDKIILLGATYEHLIQTRGENAEVTRQVEYQLAREQLAMQRLENQMESLNEQTKIAIGFNFEFLAMIEPLWKGIDAAIAAGRTLPLPVPQAKAAAAAATVLMGFTAGTIEATSELEEENPAKILDESFRQAASSIDDSWQRISESTQRATANMQADIERTSELKIFPDFNEVDFIRIVKVLEDYRPSEAIANAIELFKQSDSVIGKLSAALLGLGYTTATIGQPFIEYAQTALDSFRELATAAKELNIPLARTSDLMSKISLAGADYNDVRDYVRGVQDAVIKGDSEDPEVLALEKYGVVIQDTNGKLLDFDETLDRLYQGYLKARDAGEAEAYVIMTNGQAVQDILPYFENLAQAEEDIAKIKWSTIDYATLSELSRNMKLADTQIEEFKKSLSSLAAPAANMALETTIDTFKDLTEIVEENREEIIYWSFVLMEGVKSLQDFALELGGEAKDKILDFVETLKSIDESLGISDKIKSLFADEPVKDIAEEAKESLIPFYKELKQLEEEFGIISEIERFLPEGFSQEIDDAINNYLVPFYQVIKDIREEFSITNKLKSLLPDELINGAGEVIDSIFARAQEDLEEFKKANAEANLEIEKTKDYLDGLSYSLNRIAKYKVELENLKFDIQYGKDYSYEKLVAQNKLWYDQAMKDAKQYADEKAIIEEIYAAKSEQIEQEKEQKLAEIRERITAGERTELEKRIADIEREKQTWMQAGMEKAEAEQLAQQQLSSYVSGINQQLSAEITSLGQNDLQKKLSQIEQEKQAWIKKGADVAQAEQLAQQKIRQAHQETEDRLNAIRDSVAALDRSEFENRLAQIEQEKNSWIAAGMEKAEAEELAQHKITKAVESYNQQRDAAAKSYAEAMENYEKQVAQARKSYIQQVRAAQEEADRKNKQERQDALNILKSEAKEFNAFMKGGYQGLQEYRYKQLIKQGVNPEYLKQMTPELMDKYRAAQEKADRSFLPNWRDRNYPRHVDKPEMPKKPEEPAILDDSSKSMANVASSADKAAASLDNLAQSAGYKPVDGIGDLRAYERPDGSTLITNDYQSLKDDINKTGQSLKELNEPIENTTSALNELPTNIQDAVEKQEGVQEVTITISNFATALSEILSQIQSSVSAIQAAPTNNVNIPITINEAHAWDSEHIQGLADKVADRVEPAVIGAIGGDDNSY